MVKNCRVCTIELNSENTARKSKKYLRTICKPCYSKYICDYKKIDINKEFTSKRKRTTSLNIVPCEQCGKGCYKNYEKAFCSNICRFLSYVTKNEDASGCWIWGGGKDRYGYGKSTIYGKSITAHRLSYFLFNGNLPDVKLVCHTCDNRACVNPNHLWLGTVIDNMMDMIKKGRHARCKNLKEKVSNYAPQ